MAAQLPISAAGEQTVLASLGCRSGGGTEPYGGGRVAAATFRQ